MVPFTETVLDVSYAAAPWWAKAGMERTSRPTVRTKMFDRLVFMMRLQKHFVRAIPRRLEPVPLIAVGSYPCRWVTDVIRVSVRCDTAHIPHSITWIVHPGWQDFTLIVMGVTTSRAAKH